MSAVASTAHLFLRGTDAAARAASSSSAKRQGGQVDNAPAAIDIDGFRNGDPTSCRRVLEEYSPLIWSVVASYVRNPDERDDVYQEICVRIWERRAQYAGRGSLAGWINRAAHRWCYNWRHGHRRRESSKRRYAAEAAALAYSPSLIDDPDRVLMSKEFMQRLREGLARLPRKQSDTFVLVRLKGYSIAEAAGALKVRPATVRSNLRYANRKLRKLLKEFEHGLS